MLHSPAHAATALPHHLLWCHTYSAFITLILANGVSLPLLEEVARRLYNMHAAPPARLTAEVMPLTHRTPRQVSWLHDTPTSDPTATENVIATATVAHACLHASLHGRIDRGIATFSNRCAQPTHRTPPSLIMARTPPQWLLVACACGYRHYRHAMHACMLRNLRATSALPVFASTISEPARNAPGCIGLLHPETARALSVAVHSGKAVQTAHRQAYMGCYRP